MVEESPEKKQKVETKTARTSSNGIESNERNSLQFTLNSSSPIINVIEDSPKKVLNVRSSPVRECRNDSFNGVDSFQFDSNNTGLTQDYYNASLVIHKELTREMVSDRNSEESSTPEGMSCKKKDCTPVRSAVGMIDSPTNVLVSDSLLVTKKQLTLDLFLSKRTVKGSVLPEGKEDSTEMCCDATTTACSSTVPVTVNLNEVHLDLLNKILPEQLLKGVSAVDLYFGYRLYMLHKRDYYLNVSCQKTMLNLKRRYRKLVSYINLFEFGLVTNGNHAFDDAEILVGEMRNIASVHDEHMNKKLTQSTCQKVGKEKAIYVFNTYYQPLIKKSKKEMKVSKKGVTLKKKLY